MIGPAGTMSISVDAARPCPALFVEGGPGDGWCTLGESCLAFDRFHDYGLYRGAHTRVVCGWLTGEGAE